MSENNAPPKRQINWTAKPFGAIMNRAAQVRQHPDGSNHNATLHERVHVMAGRHSNGTMRVAIAVRSFPSQAWVRSVFPAEIGGVR